MNPPTPPAGREQRLLRNARREGLVILIAWAVALTWSVGGGYVFGYRRDPATIGTVLGVPDWVFWCVVLPWGMCGLFAAWFCFRFMADDDLGRDRDEGEPHA
jgi:hypothetical protein